MADRSLLGALYQTGLTIWNGWKAKRVRCPVCAAKPGHRCEPSVPPMPYHQKRIDVALGVRCSRCDYFKHENVYLIPRDRCPSCGSSMSSF